MLRGKMYDQQFLDLIFSYILRINLEDKWKTFQVFRLAGISTVLLKKFKVYVARKQISK